MSPQKQHMFDNPRNLKRLLKVFYVICGALVVADLVHHRHVVHPWEHLWGFYAVFGFVACVILVLVAKEMRKVLMRSVDYYDAD